MHLADRETLRLRYRPETIELLFIGEAPPASGRFFYRRDSGLYRAIRDLFESVDPAITEANFLHVFRASGCYLTDLCGQPVDHLEPPARRKLCREREPWLADLLRELNPRRTVTLLKAIDPNVRRAIALASWPGQNTTLPYPGRWKRHREAFFAGLAPILRPIIRELPTPGRNGMDDGNFRRE